MQQYGLFHDLKQQLKHGGVSMKLLFLNSSIFLIIHIALVIGRLFNDEASVSSFLHQVFAMETSLGGFISHPWGLLTSVFAHFSAWHLLFNMIFLYFSGKIFEQLFDGRRLVYLYVLGGIAGGLFEVIAHAFFPALQGSNAVIVGASGSIMAIFFSIAFYRPQLKVNLFGIFPVQIIWIALAFLVLDFINLGRSDGTAHFAHIGGAIIGLLSVQQINSKNNIINVLQRITDHALGLFRKDAKMKVAFTNAKKESDEAYRERKKNEQDAINRILEKIAKSGYDSLTKKEKDFLFNQSKK